VNIIPLRIGGEACTPSARLEVRAPYDDTVVGTTGLADERQIARALSVAERGFARARRQPPEERADLLQRVAEMLARRRDEFVALIVAEAGKPVTLARVEVERAQTTFALAATAARGPLEQTLDMAATAAGAGHRGRVRRFPLGVILGITPFNFPLNLVAHKVAPALATGNSLIVKPSPRTPLTALLLGEVLEACGATPGQITMLPFDHTQVPAVLGDPRVKMLSFTGSDAVGWALKASAPKLKATLELGGNAACLVAENAAWRRHLGSMVKGAFGYAGQSCISVQRILVPERLQAEFREAFLETVAAQAVTGDPADPRTLAGPMIADEAVDRIHAWVAEAEARGGRVLTRPRTEGRVVHPLVLADVPRDARVVRDEAFAPVVVLDTYREWTDGLAAVNDSRFGLQAGLFTDDEAQVAEAYDTLEVGGVLVNQVPTFRTENMPYGGVKDSGCGREGLPWAMEDMTEPKALVINERAD